jgi:prepilin-type N-terminal cleavage/methylation domain-containing protein
MSKNKQIKNKGFTLLEILLVTGIIGILTAIVIIAINPGRSLAKARDVQRKVGITEINKGLEQYYIDNNRYPTSINGSIGSLQSICVTGASATSTGFECDGMVDLSMLVPTYLPSIPADPTGVGYKVGFNSSRRIMLVADLTETVSPLIAIGTTTYPVVAVVDSCVSGDATDADCWSIATSSLAWGPNPSTTGVSTSTVLLNGKANTNILMERESQHSESYPAAHYCATLTEGNVPDGTWYLPSINQLTAGLEAYKSHYGSDPTWGGFVDGKNYWSSTEDSFWPGYYALIADYISGYNGVVVYTGFKNSTDYQTRCLR